MNTRFHPSDYPGYTFDPKTGTPTRTATPKRGPFAGTPNREPRSVIRKSDGRECFHLQRKDGKFRLVSRDLILATLDPWAAAEASAKEPAPLPPWSFEIQGFAGYAVVLDPFSVIRYDNPATGPVDPPVRIKTTVSYRHTLDRTYEYHRFALVDENTGRRRQVSAEKVMELAGITAADIAAAHKRHLAATRTPVPESPPCPAEAVARALAEGFMARGMYEGFTPPPPSRTPIPDSGIGEAALHEAAMLEAFGPHGQG